MLARRALGSTAKVDDSCPHHVQVCSRCDEVVCAEKMVVALDGGAGVPLVVLAEDRAVLEARLHHPSRDVAVP